MSSETSFQSIYPKNPIGLGAGFLSGYAFKSKDFISEGIPVIKIKNIKDGRVCLDEYQCVSPEIITEKLKRFLLKDGDILIAMTGQGSVGRVGRLTCSKDELLVMNQRVGKFITDEKNLNKDYLYHVASYSYFERVFFSLGSGSGQPNLNPETILSVNIPMPAYQEQVEISLILNKIDERINALRETNTTLEAIAQALFKSWFVDFDPVHAKQQGRAPEGMDAQTAALFPDSFEESELRMVPKGWRVAKVSEVADVVKGKSYSSKDLVEGGSTALVTLKSFERGGGFRMDGFKPYIGNYKPSQVVNAGDLIIAYTDVTQAAELIGKPAIVIGVEEYSVLVASLDVGVVRPNSANIGKQFLYGLFKTEDFQSHTLAHTSGTTVLHLAKDGVGSFSFVLPPAELILAFEKIADAVSERIQINIDLIRTLTSVRDTLLPRLISGQLRLPEAKALVEEAVDA